MSYESWLWLLWRQSFPSFATFTISSTSVFRSFTMICLGMAFVLQFSFTNLWLYCFGLKVLSHTPFKHCFCAILFSSKTPITYIRLSHCFPFIFQFFYPSASPCWVFSSELPSKFTNSLFECLYNLLVSLLIPV